jgi:hypothetical protein
MTHGMMQELNRRPAKDEHACIGTLLNRVFLKGRYIGSHFGAKVVAVTDNYYEANVKRESMIKLKRLDVSTSDTRIFGDVGLVVDVPQELVHKRLEKFESGYFHGMKEHDESDGGFLYCGEHAREVNYECPTCRNDLVSAGSKSFRALEVMSGGTPDLFLEVLTDKSMFCQDAMDKVREAKRALVG